MPVIVVACLVILLILQKSLQAVLPPQVQIQKEITELMMDC